MAVVCGRRFFRVELIDEATGAAHSSERVAAALESIQAAVAAAGGAAPAAEDVGLLTAGDRDRWSAQSTPLAKTRHRALDHSQQARAQPLLFVAS